MSKSPAFQWYAADYLADERVMQLTLEAEAVYVRLLNYCWREGTIPANASQCAPMCKYADVKVIKAALALFTKSPTQPGRLIHKRLEEERAKQEEYRARQSAKGAKGGRPRKADEKPEKPAALPGLNAGLAPVKPDESSSTSTSSSIPSNDGSAGETSPTDLPTPAPEPPSELAGPPAVGGDPIVRTMALAHSDPADEQHWSESPLVKPQPFRVICERLGHLGIDFEYYRKVALIAAQDANTSRTVTQWTSWIRKFFENQLRGGGPLLKPTDREAARTGVHAPQHPDAYQHQVREDLQRQRRAEQQARDAARIAANLARHQQPTATA